jgi:hypothetical protein
LRIGDGLSFFAQTIEVERDSLVHILFNFFAGAAGGNATREVGR